MKKIPRSVRAHFARLGRIKSPARAAASRRNGTKGGRPRKHLFQERNKTT